MTAKPMSFCLPGYRKSLRRCHLLEGGLGGLSCGLIVLSTVCLRWPFRGMFDDMLDSAAMPRDPFEWLEPVQVGLAVFGVFCAGMAVHASASALGYGGSRCMRGGAVVVDCVVWQLIVINSVMAELCPPTVWFWLLPIWLALGVFSWIRLGDMRYVGQGHRVLLNAESNWLIRIARVQGTWPSVETRFLGLMQGHGFLSLRRYCWGVLYENFAIMVSHPAWVIIFTGYALTQEFISEALAGFAFVIFFGFLAVGLHLPLAPRRILLLPAGRRERSIATGLTAMVASLVFATTGGVVVAASWLLWLVVQALPWERVASAYSGINPTWFYWPCLLVPWVTAARLLRGWPARMVQGGLVVAVSVLMGGLYLLYIHAVPAWKVHAAYLGVFACGWLLLLVVLRVSFRTCDLASVGA